MMQQHLVIILLFTGIPSIYPGSPYKYFLIQLNKTWSDAQTYCRSNHTDLVTVRGSDVMSELQMKALNQQVSSDAWIGLQKQFHDWSWSLGNEPLGSVTNWCNGEPDSQIGINDCIYTSPTCWACGPCSYPEPFVCFDASKTGADMYIFYTTASTWFAGQAYCRLYHTDLASVRDSAEIEAIRATTKGWTWIGLARSSWSWSDQTDTPSIMWAPGAPSSAVLNSDCGYINNGQVFDTLCTDAKPFFCYSVITGQRQVIRFKVQSDQDLNDPALMDLLLQQILQKLKDHGLENVLVRWRKQTNGKIFQKMRIPGLYSKLLKPCIL